MFGLVRFQPFRCHGRKKTFHVSDVRRRVEEDDDDAAARHVDLDLLNAALIAR
jgi:hypothetical protein